jgi:asparagine synthase (glutamine-hydrolysing)
MCGIVGIANVDGQPVDADRLIRMRDRMVHRGPDDEGLYVSDGVGLGHRRLSILDLSSAGHQPMANETEDLWMVFNGEIFNFVELRQKLIEGGHRFRSDSDSEVIVHAYEDAGVDCVDVLNGMFAFAIWDSRRRTLYAARDRMGIKPFFYFWDGRHFVFASEIKAILEHPDVPCEPDPLAIADYMFCGQTLAGRTFFKGIHELRPGRALMLEDGDLREWEYWRLEYAYDHARSDADWIEEFADLLDDAVRIHCRSDAALGCHLSGGFDSSTVACLTAKHRGPVKSFSVRSPGGAFFDETAYAKAVSRHAGTEYLETTADATDIARLTTRLLWHMDMPMATPGGVNYHAVSRLAADHVKVSLTGHGGDELFAGYPAQFQVHFGTTAMFDHSADPVRPGASRAFRLLSLWRREGLGGFASRLRGRFEPRDAPTPEAVWMQLHCGRPVASNPHLDPGFVAGLRGYAPEDDYLAAFREPETDVLLDRALHHDLRCYLPSLLHMEDRVSMAVSLESRVPLLDYRIAELAARVPLEAKVKDRVPKRLLRDAAKRWLPDAVLQRRDKAGFAMPVESWFEGELAADLRRVLDSPTSRARGIFDPRVLGDRNFWVADGWKALNVELWFRLFVDRNLEPDTPLGGIE